MPNYSNDFRPLSDFPSSSPVPEHQGSDQGPDQGFNQGSDPIVSQAKRKGLTPACQTHRARLKMSTMKTEAHQGSDPGWAQKELC